MYGGHPSIITRELKYIFLGERRGDHAICNFNYRYIYLISVSISSSPFITSCSPFVVYIKDNTAHLVYDM